VNRLASLFFICSFIVCGQDVVHTSTLTLGVGGLPYSYDAEYPTLQKGGLAFTGNYEYRLSRYLAVEAGTDILLPSGQAFLGQASILSGENLIPYYNYTASGCTTGCVHVSGRSQVTLLTYGFKGILPLAADRLELFAGVGGAYGWNSRLGGFLNSAYGQASVGTRVAVDRAHRFWLGTTLRGFTNFGPPGRQASLPWTFDLGIRFGH
jgi:hypothetical protein